MIGQPSASNSALPRAPMALDKSVKRDSIDDERNAHQGGLTMIKSSRRQLSCLMTKASIAS